MKSAITLKAGSIFLAVLILFSSCSSTTMIQSEPSGAKVYLNGEPVGTTPYAYSDTKIVGSVNSVELVKDGYAPLNTYFSRDEEVDVGAIIGGLFVLVPFLWTMKYKPVHTYELAPLADYEPAYDQPNNFVEVKSKAERLRELKKLLDDKIINQEEFDQEKQKILAEDEK